MYISERISTNKNTSTFFKDILKLYRLLIQHISVSCWWATYMCIYIYIGILADNNIFQYCYLRFTYTMLHMQLLKHTSALSDVYYIYIGILTNKNIHNIGFSLDFFNLCMYTIILAISLSALFDIQQHIFLHRKIDKTKTYIKHFFTLLFLTLCIQTIILGHLSVILV